MRILNLSILIAAPQERVFDLSRSIDLHQDSTHGTDEKAVAGVTAGLIGLGQEVTWEARHFGIKQRLTSKITQFDRPNHFQDVMQRGAFKHLIHDHTFKEADGKTQLLDRFEFSAPLGPLGLLAEWLFLARYLQRFLEQRNQTVKRIAESDEWKKYLS